MTLTLVPRLELDTVHGYVAPVPPGLVALGLGDGLEDELQHNEIYSLPPPSLPDSYRVLLGIRVQNLRLFPGVESVVDKRGQHHVVVEVRIIGVLVQVDRVEQDPEPVRRQAGDGVPERDAVSLGPRGGQQGRLYQSGLPGVAGLALGQRGSLQENVSSLQAGVVVMVVSGSSDPKGVVPLAGSPPEVGNVLQVVPAAGPDVQTRAEVAICLRVERRILSPLSLLSGQLREKLVNRSKKF